MYPSLKKELRKKKLSLLYLGPNLYNFYRWLEAMWRL
jgi:hypothetical protein